MDDITRAAEKLNVEIQYHSKQALSRISKNGREDQGVALDIQFASYQPLDDFLEQAGQIHVDRTIDDNAQRAI